jgi:hypothetical protein
MLDSRCMSAHNGRDSFVIDLTSAARIDDIGQLTMVQGRIKRFEPNHFLSHRVGHTASARENFAFVKETAHSVTLKAPYRVSSGKPGSSIENKTLYIQSPTRFVNIPRSGSSAQTGPTAYDFYRYVQKLRNIAFDITT